MMQQLPPVHPGEHLRLDYLPSCCLTPGKLAKAIHVPRSRIERLVKEKIGISTDTALRLARYFGTSVEFWTNLQREYEVQCLLPKIKHQLEEIVPINQ